MMVQRSNHGPQQRRSEKAPIDLAPPELVEDSEDSDDDCQHKRHTARKQKQHARRQCFDHVRLYLLQGRSGRFLPPIQAWIMAAMLGVSVAAFWNTNGLPDVLVGYRNPQTTEWRAKPIMVGAYFQNVDSGSFVGKVQRIDPPRGRREWTTLLENRLRHRHNHLQQQQQSHHQHEILPGLVEPMSLQLQYIETGSERYDHKPQNTPHPEQCEPMHEWQTKSFPSCNNLHEHTLMRDRFFWDDTSSVPDHHDNHHNNPNQPLEKKLRRRLLERTRQAPPPSHSTTHYQLLAHGFWRDTWLMQQPSTTSEAGSKNGNEMERVAMKTMRFEHDHTEFVYDKQRRDALTSDRLSFSDHAIHMWAYCGTSALYEYAPGGDLTRFLDRFDTAEDWRSYYTPEERYRLAFNVSAALADLHNTENKQGEDGPSAIVHADFNVNQFVAMTETKKDVHLDKNGKLPIPEFKLGDFNLAKFIYKNPKQHHPCTVQTEASRGNWRAPEEYNKRGRTEKLDIYSLGNLLYVVLTGSYPFEDVPDAKTREMVIQGQRPHIDKSIQHSDDPHIKALLAAIEMCWRQDPHDRPSAREIKHYLAKHFIGDTTVGHHHHHGLRHH